MRRWVVAWSVVVALAAAVASAAPPPLTVFAASDLAFAFREIVPKFETAAGARVTLVLGSTGNLAKQIEHGAPADVFFAADQRFVDELVAKGALIAESRALYAQGRLVLATAPGAGAKLTALSQLREPRIRRVAIGSVLLGTAGVAWVSIVPVAATEKHPHFTSPFILWLVIAGMLCAACGLLVCGLPPRPGAGLVRLGHKGRRRSTTIQEVAGGE